MIIRGLFKRYERWNPVHPTAGTFWGMGFGLGCGVGWGPGFGPEVVGYVGSGCGVGFCVGLTLAGAGVGLPQNGLLRSSCTAVTASYENLRPMRIYALAAIKSLILATVSCLAHFSECKMQRSGKLLELKNLTRGTKMIDLAALNNTVRGVIITTVDSLKKIKDQPFPPLDS